MKVKILLLIILITQSYSIDWPWEKNKTKTCCSKPNASCQTTRDFSFEYTVDLKSSNGEKIELWIPVPQTNEVQTISNLKFDTSGLEYKIKDENRHGNKYAYIFSSTGTNTDKIITMRFDVSRIEHSNINYKKVNPESYLGANSMVPTGEVFESIIIENQLKNDENQLLQARKVYDYVLNGMHYGKPKSVDNQYYKSPWLSENGEYGMEKVSRDKVVQLYKEAKENKGNYTFGNGNSLYACNIGVGNCTDYHSYFMSLSRTMNVPARFHMGFPIPDGEEGKVGGYHCWADYYIENDGWYPVDISEADKDPNKIEYFFGKVCNNRVEMMVGRDFVLEGHEVEPVNLFIYPLLEINDQSSNAFSKSFKYKNI